MFRERGGKMSIQTWKQEFYPTEARNTLIQKALSHTIRKWKGLRPKNLRKHNLCVKRRDIKLYDKENLRGFVQAFKFNSDNCALCIHHLVIDNNIDRCETCPLYIVRGQLKCTVQRPSMETHHPFYYKPKAMLAWLQLAKGVPR